MTGLGSSILEGKCGAGLESVVNSLFPGAKRESFGDGRVFYSFDSAASANGSAGPAIDESADGTFKATLIYYGSSEGYMGFNVAVTVTSPSPVLRSEVILRVASEAHIKVVARYDSNRADPRAVSPN